MHMFMIVKLIKFERKKHIEFWLGIENIIFFIKIYFSNPDQLDLIQEFEYSIAQLRLFEYRRTRPL